MKKLTQAEKIRRYFKAHPNKSVSDVARAMGVTYQIAYMTKKTMDKRELEKAQSKEVELPKLGDTVGGLTLTKTKDNKYTWKPVAIMSSDTPLPVTMEEPAADPVNHPAHYKVGGIETIAYIKAKLTPEEYRGYLKGNILKYGSRVGHKGDAAIDAGKIGWYANELAEELKSS